MSPTFHKLRRKLMCTCMCRSARRVDEPLRRCDASLMLSESLSSPQCLLEMALGVVPRLRHVSYW